jgi:HNH endonuclease
MAMFRNGAEVAGRFDPPPRNRYMCPTCLREFGEDDAARGALTEEHVPPEALGGAVLALTCSSCNSTSGHRLDHHMVSWHQLLTFGTSLASPLPAQATFGGVTQRGEALVTDDVFLFAGVRKQNHPEIPAALTAEIEGLRAAENLRGTFSLRLKVDERLARIGWMRAAYLVAFCQFGYSCITTPPYERVRQQIQHPDTELIDPRLVTVDRDADPQNRAIVVPHTPPLLADALIIVCGWYSVILARPDAPDDFYDRLADGVLATPMFAWQGSAAPWPERLIGTLDQ